MPRWLHFASRTENRERIKKIHNSIFAFRFRCNKIRCEHSVAVLVEPRSIAASAIWINVFCICMLYHICVYAMHTANEHDQTWRRRRRRKQQYKWIRNEITRNIFFVFGKLFFFSVFPLPWPLPHPVLCISQCQKDARSVFETKKTKRNLTEKNSMHRIYWPRSFAQRLWSLGFFTLFLFSISDRTFDFQR